MISQDHKSRVLGERPRHEFLVMEGSHSEHLDQVNFKDKTHR